MMLFHLFFLFCGSATQKISHLTALLQFKDPNSKNTPHFTLSAEGDCFNWYSMNQNIVRLYPTSQCSQSAEVEVVATGPNRRATSIYAESKSGTTLKCDIFVDSIKNISIATTTRSIYLESSLETLSLLAADSETNIFTSLEGSDIQWKIDEEHLRVITPIDANISFPTSSNNKLIIQGIKVGKAWVEATLSGKYHARVELFVVKPILLNPSPIVRTLPYHHIPFKLCSAKKNSEIAQSKGISNGLLRTPDHITHVEIDQNRCYAEINLPTKNYNIETSDHSVLTATKAAFASTHKPGNATITIVDNSLPDNTASSFVIVQYPDDYEQPDQWIALGDDPVFDPILKDKDGNLLDIFEPIPWKIIGKWDTIGKKEIILQYHDYRLTAIVYVCPPIEMDPPEAVLPVSYHGYEVKPKGGSGFYEFSVSDSTILSYNNYRVSTYIEGKAQIRVQDKKIKKFNSSCEILVSRVAEIKIDIPVRELIGDYFQPICDIYAIEGKRFSVELPNRTVSTNPGIVSPTMKAQHPGFANIYCESMGTKSPQIKVSSAYNLTASVNGRGSPNSDIPLSYSGGVLRWPEATPPEITVSCPGAKVYNFNYSHFSIDREYSGYCTATMQNRKTELNPVPLVVHSSFWLNVSHVYILDLYPTDDKATDIKECNCPPKSLDFVEVLNHLHYVTNNNGDFVKQYRIVPRHTYKLYVFPRDKLGNIIVYYSAVHFQLIPNFAEPLTPTDNHGRHGETIFYYTPMETTDLTITAPGLKNSITSLVEIQPFVVAKEKVVYYKPGMDVSFPIEAGSSFFRTSSPDARLIDGSVHITPTHSGTTRVNVTDICTDQPMEYLSLNAISVEEIIIDAPSVVLVNTPFDAYIRLYSEGSRTFPDDLLPNAQLTVSPYWSTQIKPTTWNFLPREKGSLRITATTENGVSGSAVVEVIEQLVIAPQYIELLPGETQNLEIIKGHRDIVFDFDDGTIAKVGKETNTFYVLGVSPGYIVINASMHLMNRDQIAPFPIYVHVLTPLQLNFVESTTMPIQEGYLGLSLVVLTENGERIPRKAKWTWLTTNDHIQVNDSFAFVNLSTNDVHVDVEAYSLAAKYHKSIEAKLILLTPQFVNLPPHCSYQIEIVNYGTSNMIQDCVFYSDDESIVMCENGLIKSFSNEGETNLHIKYGHQHLVVTVQVSKPTFLHIHQVSLSDFKLMLLDPHGRLYSSINGVKLTLNGPEGFVTDDIESDGSVRTQFSSDNIIELHSTASNSDFSLETSINVSVKQRVMPENVVLMRGATKQFQCTALKPMWSSSDRTLLTITPDGTASGHKNGTVKIYCSKSPKIESTVLVTSIDRIDIEKRANDEFEIIPVYSSPFKDVYRHHSMNLIEAPDLTYNCSFEHTECATVQFKRNETGLFCNLTRKFYYENTKKVFVKCPPKSQITVTATSQIADLNLRSFTPIPYIGIVDFGIAKENEYYINDLKRKVEVPIKPSFDEISIEQCPKDIRIDPNPSGGIVIRAEEKFKQTGVIVLQHKETGETVKIIIIHDNQAYTESAFHNRTFGFNQNMLFFLAIITLYSSIYFIIFLCTSK